MPKNEEKEKQAEAQFTIEELAARLGEPAWALAGAKVRYGWGAGKSMPEKEFREAMAKFRRGPASV